ncbi:MAG: DUF1638 domain-containing protein [Geodermatophilaceae bacterium]|nr:DUF1638 domain-containing protein [Geodermatophilaceae bacterium]
MACGALSRDIGSIVDRNGWAVDVYPLPPLLHNRPERIAAAVEASVDDLELRYDRIGIAYADCGTYGALDEVCRRRGLQRLPGLHCYDLYAGPERIRTLIEDEPGTYFLTDFLVASFDRTVTQELGLDRHPELRDAYFGNYTRVVWLATRPTAELATLADRAATTLGLPLSVVTARLDRLTLAMSDLLAPARAFQPGT